MNEIYETYKKTDKTINNSVKDNEIYNLFLKNLKNNKTFHKNELKLSEKKVKEHKDKLTEIEQQTSDIDKIIIVNQINVDPSLFDDEIHKKNLIVAIKEWINQEKVKLENKQWKKQIINGMKLSEYEEKFIKSKKIKREMFVN